MSHKNVARLHYTYMSLTIQTVYHFNRMECFYKHYLLPATIKCIYVQWFADFNQILNLSTGFHKSPQHQFSNTPFERDLCWYIRTERQMPTACCHLQSRTALYAGLISLAKIKRTYIFMFISIYFSLISIKFGFYWHIFIWNFMEVHVLGAMVIHAAGRSKVVLFATRQT
jgi:hypothetical protein